MASLALILTALLVFITISHAQDPTCATGFKAGGACCPASCTRCGGPSCQNLPGGGANCCRQKVLSSGVSCTTSNPPCVIGATTTTTPPTTGNPTTATTSTTATSGGSPIWKNIDSDMTGTPRARHEACFVMARGKGYLIGGRGNRGMDIFHPKNRTWTKGPDPPTQMHHMQCVVVGAKIFIPSSWFGGNPEKENTRMYVYNTRTRKWSSKRGLPARRRRGGAASVLVGRKIYVVAGNRGGHGPPARTLGWMDYYDMDTKKWVTDLDDLPVPRDHVGGALVKGQLCIAGGRNGGASNFFAATEKSVFCYDFVMGKWIKKKDIPTPRAGAATITLCDGRMMVAGGEGKFSRAFDQVEIFDGNNWTTGPSLQRRRHGTGLAIAAKCSCGQVFIASGSGSRGGGPELTETEVYLPNGRDRICRRY